MRVVALIAVGSELLRFDRQDTKAGWLTEQLARHGVAVRGRCQVEDDERPIAGAVRWTTAEYEIVIVCGGLGPTEDDRTRRAVSNAAASAVEDLDRQMSARLGLDL